MQLHIEIAFKKIFERHSDISQRTSLKTSGLFKSHFYMEIHSAIEHQNWLLYENHGYMYERVSLRMTVRT